MKFEPAHRARLWQADMQGVAEVPKFKALLPVYAYARTIIAHHFPDGNGRLARALLLAALAREADLQAPSIAHAPAFYKNASTVADGLQALSRDGDWGAFTLVLVRVLREAMEMSRSGWKIKI